MPRRKVSAAPPAEGPVGDPDELSQDELSQPPAPRRNRPSLQPRPAPPAHFDRRPGGRPSAHPGKGGGPHDRHRPLKPVRAGP